MNRVNSEQQSAEKELQVRCLDYQSSHSWGPPAKPTQEFSRPDRLAVLVQLRNHRVLLFQALLGVGNRRELVPVREANSSLKTHAAKLARRPRNIHQGAVE